jgi:hypothetical protein
MRLRHSVPIILPHSKAVAAQRQAESHCADSRRIALDPRIEFHQYSTSNAHLKIDHSELRSLGGSELLFGEEMRQRRSEVDSCSFSRFVHILYIDTSRSRRGKLNKFVFSYRRSISFLRSLPISYFFR